jgi:hypothetical protein
MTTYNESINYNASINYNGATTPPVPPPVIAGGFVNHPYHSRKKEFYGDDDFAIVLSVLELLDEE